MDYDIVIRLPIMATDLEDAYVTADGIVQDLVNFVYDEGYKIDYTVEPTGHD